MGGRVLHIARWASARVYKQVLAQQWAGWDVTLMAGQSPHIDLHSMVDKQVGWCNTSVMRDLVYDVVILHTTIDTFRDSMDLILPAANKYVWDCHDYVNDLPMQHRDFDAVTCPSVGMAKHFGDNGHVIYSKVPEKLWPVYDETRPIVDAVVFQGTMGNGEAWADYSGLEKRLDTPVFFYPSGDAVQGHEGCRLMKRLPYLQMLDALQYYLAGYAGASRSDVTIHDCVTNKFWEYKAAGLPVITYNSNEMEELNGDVNIELTMESELEKMKEVYCYEQ